jgi:hypothetical protein
MNVKTGLSAGAALNGAQGLGDVIAVFTHRTGLDQLSKRYEEITGQSCGCQERQRKLNTAFPFTPTA